MLGSGHYSGGGGKGANQAVAAARAGARVAMVGRVGADEHGRELTAALAADGIDVHPIGVDETTPTGIAVITIDSNAENTIVVSPGANMQLRAEHLDGDLIASAPVVLAQLEVPVETVAAAAVMARGIFVLNPAPARGLPDELLENVDVLIPNRSELATLTGGGHGEVEEAAQRLGRDGPTVVTLGSEGAMLVHGERATRFAAPRVEAVDPTGAGDAFCGALAQALSRGVDLAAAVERAVVAGALATTRPGAQTAMPTADQIDALLGASR